MKTAPSVVGPLSDGPVGKRCFNEKIVALGFPQLTAILTRKEISLITTANHIQNYTLVNIFVLYFCN